MAKNDRKDAIERALMLGHLSKDKRINISSRATMKKDLEGLVNEFKITGYDVQDLKDSLKKQGKKIQSLWKI